MKRQSPVIIFSNSRRARERRTLSAAYGVDRDSDQGADDDDHRDCGNQLAHHNVPIRSMHRSICRCKPKITKLSTTTPISAIVFRYVGSSKAESSQPATLMSIRTRI